MEKMFLALDYKDEERNIRTGKKALEQLGQFYENKIGLKLNPASFIGEGATEYSVFEGVPIFVDTKFGRGPDNAKRSVDKINDILPINYFTVAANLGEEKLKDYVKMAEDYNSKVIAYTIHTKIPEKDVKRIYNNPLEVAMYNLGELAYDAGCDAMVLEARMLNDKDILELPIKKLVTGIRFDLSEKGTQSRITTFDELANMKDKVDYSVISKRYIEDPYKLDQIATVLLK